MQVAVKIILILIILGIVSTGVTFGILDIIKQLKNSDGFKFTPSKLYTGVSENAETEDNNTAETEDNNTAEKIIPKLVSGSYYTGPLAGKTQQVLCGKIWNNIDVNYDLPIPIDQNLGPVSPEYRAE